MARRTWYRLDNIGKFYSSQAGRSSQTVFRYSADLADDIDPDILQHALDHAIAQFPSFNVHLLNGMFWHYLEQSDGRWWSRNICRYARDCITGPKACCSA